MEGIMTALNDFMTLSTEIVSSTKGEITIPRDDVYIILTPGKAESIRVYENNDSLQVLYMPQDYLFVNSDFTLHQFPTYSNFQQRFPSDKTKEIKYVQYDNSCTHFIALETEEDIFNAMLVHSFDMNAALELMSVLAEVPEDVTGIITIRTKYNEELLLKCNSMMRDYISNKENT